MDNPCNECIIKSMCQNWCENLKGYVRERLGEYNLGFWFYEQICFYLRRTSVGDTLGDRFQTVPCIQQGRTKETGRYVYVYIDRGEIKSVREEK